MAPAELVDLRLRWFTAFRGHGGLADRAILFSARMALWST
jgi:hypothetical protein